MADDCMKEIAVKKVVIQIGNREIELTVDELKKLQTEIDKLLVKTSYVPYYLYYPYTSPWTPSTPYYVYTTPSTGIGFGTSSTQCLSTGNATTL